MRDFGRPSCHEDVIAQQVIERMRSEHDVPRFPVLPVSTTSIWGRIPLVFPNGASLDFRR